MWLLGVGSVLLLFGGVLSKFSLKGVRCGAENCNLNEFCSKFGSSCMPCSEICDESHHNKDEKTCEDECQKQTYTVQHTATISLILSCLTLLGFFILLFLVIRRIIRKRNITLSTITSKFTSNKKSNKQAPTVAVTNTSGKPDLHLDMPPVQNHFNHTPTTVHTTPSTASTNISRRPTEDSTLDYAYDNPAMATTPSPNNKIAKPYESSL